MQIKNLIPLRRIRKLLQENIMIQNRMQADMINLHATLNSLYRLHLLENKKYQDEKRLELYGYKVYSQNDEDGILAEIFRRIGTTNKFFVEFGVMDGLECNSHYLLLQGWNGVFIEGSKEYYKKIQKAFEEPIQQKRLVVINEFITAENINALIGKASARDIVEIDLLSIDIDGNDYHVFKAINIINPRVVVIEFNATFPPPMQWIMPYNPNHIWDGSENQGSSLQSLALLAQEKGYKLVGTNINGVNAFFVRKDLCENKFCEDDTALNLYNSFYRMYHYYNEKACKKHLANMCL